MKESSLLLMFAVILVLCLIFDEPYLNAVIIYFGVIGIICGACYLEERDNLEK